MARVNGSPSGHIQSRSDGARSRNRSAAESHGQDYVLYGDFSSAIWDAGTGRPVFKLTANCELSLCFPQQQLGHEILSRMAEKEEGGSSVGEIGEE